MKLSAMQTFYYPRKKTAFMNIIKKFSFLLITILFTQQLFAQAPTITSFSPITAGPGDTVTIIGTNFVNVGQVELGNYNVAFRIISSTEILGFEAAGASSGDVVVITDSGTASLPGFVWNGNPIINSIVPDTARRGDTVTITGKYLAPGVGILPTFISFGGVPATAIIGVNGFNSPTVKAVVGNGASGNVFLTSGYTNTSTTFPGFVFEQNCAVTSTTNVAICASVLPYSWNGKTIVTAGTYIDSLKSIAGCDSIATLNLTVNATSTSGIDTTICSSKLPYLWNGLSLSSQGTYNVTLTNAVGCDSIATLHLVIALCTPPVIPTITSFSPTSGPIGTAVTITGTNFNTTAANNIIYFGAVKAVVTNANATTLNVIVPVGATYQPITVTTNGLTAFSSQSFDITFTGAGIAFTKNSFSSPINAMNTNSSAFALGDLDGDGKIDVASGNYSSTLNIFRNISVGKTISFANAIAYMTAHSGPESDNFVASVALGDFDGDGKQDIVTTSYDTVKIFQNRSTPGNINFVPQGVFFTGDYAVNIFISDLDGDGKPDLAILNENSNSISIFRNTSTADSISFVSQGAYATGSYPPAMALGDLDGDGKPDLSVAERSSAFSVYKNTSTIGSISFSARTDFPVLGYPSGISVGDLDGDGRPDVAISNFNNKASIFRNTSSPGTISFGTEIDSTTGSQPAGISIGDLDGDGKPDLAVTNSDTTSGNSVSILKNTGNTGMISFASKVDYPAGLYPTNISIGDFDGDDKPDLCINSLILRNQVGEPIGTQLCPPIGNTILIAGLEGFGYQWQVNTGTGFNNISNNSNYSGIDDDTLQLNNIPSSWYGYQYRCVANAGNSNVYTLKFTDTWISTTDSTWENAANWSCGTVPDSNTDVIINSGHIVLKSNAAVRSLTINPGASFTVVTPFTLTVTH